MQRLGRQDGFSLLEVLVAIVILSIGMLGVGTMVLTSLRQDHYTGRVRVAENLALSRLEELRGKTADGTLADITPPTSGSYDTPNIRTGEAQQFYCRQWMITDASPTIAAMSGKSIKQIDVVVGWPLDLPTCSGTNCCKEDSVEQCPYKYRARAFIVQK